MNAHQAKCIPLIELLAALGHQPKGTSAGGRQVWFSSPFRQETKPSFNVNQAENVWYDLGLSQGGNVLDFVMLYYDLTGVAAALGKLEALGLGAPKPTLPLFSEPKRAPVTAPSPTAAPGITLKKVQPLQNTALIQYVEQRGIPATLARQFVQEAYYTVPGRERTYFALAFPNQLGGVELNNQYFKGVVGRKAISLVQPAAPTGSDLWVFEGFMDFLSALVVWQLPAPTALVLILNSVALKDQAVAAIHELGVTQVQLYLDRDDAGRRLTQDFQALAELAVCDRSDLYQGCKDLNAWLVANPQPERC